MSAESLVLTAFAVVMLIAAAVFCIRQFARPISRPASPPAAPEPRPMFQVFPNPAPSDKTLLDLYHEMAMAEQTKRQKQAIADSVYGQFNIGLFGQKPAEPPKA